MDAKTAPQGVIIAREFTSRAFLNGEQGWCVVLKTYMEKPASMTTPRWSR